MIWRMSLLFIGRKDTSTDTLAVERADDSACMPAAERVEDDVANMSAVER